MDAKRHTEDITDIIRLVVEAMELEITVDNIVDNSDGTFTLETCNTEWVNPFDVIEVGEVKYEVKSYQIDKSIVIKPAKKINVTPTFTSFTLNAPHFFHGTPIQTNIELVKVDDTRDKTPMVWLVKPIREEFNGFNRRIERESSLQLFFLDETRPNEWTTQMHHDQVVKPTSRMVDRFLEVVKINQKTFDRHKGYVRIDRSNFGVFMDKQGYIKGILDDKLSGAEVNIILEIKKQNCTIVICK